MSNLAHYRGGKWVIVHFLLIPLSSAVPTAMFEQKICSSHSISPGKKNRRLLPHLPPCRPRSWSSPWPWWRSTAPPAPPRPPSAPPPRTPRTARRRGRAAPPPAGRSPGGRRAPSAGRTCCCCWPTRTTRSGCCWSHRQSPLGPARNARRPNTVTEKI